MNDEIPNNLEEMSLREFCIVVLGAKGEYFDWEDSLVDQEDYGSEDLDYEDF